MAMICTFNFSSVYCYFIYDDDDAVSGYCNANNAFLTSNMPPFTKGDKIKF